MIEPLVSICCLAYNHKSYIRQCLDGFIIQKTTFPIEILIHDDASTDGTTEIIREYESNYPEIIKPIYQSENQYSKGVKISATFNWSRVKGKYIALCEGDDYWTDPFKLQKQVDILENHPEFNVCFHQFYRLEDSEYKELNKEVVDSFMKISNYDNGFEFTLRDLFDKWFIGTLTMMFRTSILNFDIINRYTRFFDLHIFYYCLEKKNGFFLIDNMAVYRRHAGGVWAGASQKQRFNTDIVSYRELYKISPSEFTKSLYRRSKKKKLRFKLNTILNSLIKKYITKMTLLRQYFEFVIVPLVMNSPFPSIRMLFVRKMFAKIGKNTFFLRGVNFINPHNIEIGENCVLNNKVFLDGRGGKLIIGNNVDIAREVNIWTLEHNVHDDFHKAMGGEVIIEDYVWIASRVTILPSVKIGKGAVVACGAVVTKDIPSMAIVGGVPAKLIGKRKSELKYMLNYKPKFR